MKVCMMVNFNKINIMEKEFSHIKMEKNIMVIIKMASKMVKAC